MAHDDRFAGILVMGGALAVGLMILSWLRGGREGFCGGERARELAAEGSGFEVYPEATLETRARQVLAAWIRTKESPVLNCDDNNVAYNIWYGEMMRQGVPQFYATGSLFRGLIDLYRTGTMSLPEVAMLIQPYYNREAEFRRLWALQMAPQPPAPICNLR